WRTPSGTGRSSRPGFRGAWRQPETRCSCVEVLSGDGEAVDGGGGHDPLAHVVDRAGGDFAAVDGAAGCLAEQVAYPVLGFVFGALGLADLLVGGLPLTDQVGGQLYLGVLDVGVQLLEGEGGGGPPVDVGRVAILDALP